MALANITVTANTPNVTVSAGTTNVSVSQTLSNITVGTATGIATSEIRSALSNVTPILYDSSTGVFSFDNTAILNATVVDNGSLSGNITLDLDAGRIHKVGLGLGNITGITLDNITSGAAATLIFTQDAGGGVALDTTTHASNWTSWDFANDFKTFDDNPLNWTVMNLFYDGSKIYASLVTDSAGNITNDELANSNIVVNGVTIELGSSGTIVANTDLTAFSVTTNTPSGNGALSYSNTTGVFTFTPADTSSGGIDLTALSVTTNSPSGNGALSYNNTSGVFTFTPSDVPDTTDELTEGATNLYFTDARANTVIGTNTTDNLTEGATNLYYTTARANSAISTYFGDSGNFPFSFAGNLSVSGNVDVAGNLNYENVTDLYVTDQKITLNANATTDATVEIIANRPVAGANTVLRWNETDDKWQFSNDGSTYHDILTNAQAQAYIQSNGLTMTADITSSNLIGTTANLDLNSSTAVDNLYGLKWDSAVNKFISSPDAGTTAPDYLFTIEKQGTDLEAIRSRIARSGAFGWKERYEKAEGTLAVPTALGDFDETWQAEHAGYDGSSYSDTMGMHVFQDRKTAAVSSGIIPLAYEIYGKLDGNTSLSDTNLMSIHADGKIVFNDTGGSRGFNNKVGTANISRDGSIVSAADITSRANIVAEANINAAGGTLTGVLTSNANIELTDTDALFIGDMNGATQIDVYNDTGVALAKGKAVYLTGGNNGDKPNVALANNLVSANMPALGVVKNQIGIAAEGEVVTAGRLNIAAHGFTQGADLYVNGSGDLTTTIPTSEAELIQKIGKVVGPNHILVQGAFRTNATPNLDDGKIFLGNAANQASTATLDTSIVPENTNLYYTTDRANSAIEAHTGNIANLTGELATTGNVNFLGGNVEIGDTSAIFGLRNLKYDVNNNRLGIGTGDNVGVDADGSGMFGAVHILSDDSQNARINLEELDNATGGPDIRYYKGRGTYSSPAVVNAGDRISEAYYHAHDGSDYSSSRARQNVFVDDRTGTGADIANAIIPLSYEFGVNATNGTTNIFPMQIQGGSGNVLFGVSALRNTGTANATITHSGNVHTNIILPQSGANVKIDDIKPVTEFGNLTLQGNVFVDRADFTNTGNATANITAIIPNLNQGAQPSSFADSLVISGFSGSADDGKLVTPSGITDTGATQVNGNSYYIKYNASLGFPDEGYGLYSDASLTTPVQVMTSSSFIGSPSGTPIVTYAAGTFTDVKDANLTVAGDIQATNIKSTQFLQLKNYSNTEILALTGMAAGDVVFNSTDSTIAFYEGSNWKNLTVTGNVT